MKRTRILLMAFLVVMGFWLMPAIAGAEPGNGNGDGNAGGNGNHYGWDNGNRGGGAQPVPEPLTLLLLGSGMVGLAVIKKRTT